MASALVFRAGQHHSVTVKLRHVVVPPQNPADPSPACACGIVLWQNHYCGVGQRRLRPCSRHSHQLGNVLSGVRRENGPIVGRIGRSFLRFNQGRHGPCLRADGRRQRNRHGYNQPLSYKGSVVCTDIKGENRAFTERQRQKMGRVRALDTLKPRCSDKFNPLGHGANRHLAWAA
ncbi:type IV secretory system conjugative DNA transfer family protein [Bradyrhizobium sp. STM 3561]|uniref:type IV secretory system conjugative DNA transfer family protein n=1 Tax=Bradyrhizobium sp. STM 3561 TaxID=578923 RepID=UPI0038906565